MKKWTGHHTISILRSCTKISVKLFSSSVIGYMFGIEWPSRNVPEFRHRGRMLKSCRVCLFSDTDTGGQEQTAIYAVFSFLLLSPKSIVTCYYGDRGCFKLCTLITWNTRSHLVLIRLELTPLFLIFEPMKIVHVIPNISDATLNTNLLTHITILPIFVWLWSLTPVVVFS